MPRHRSDEPEQWSEEESAEFRDSLAGEIHTLRLHRADLHTRGILRLMRQRFAEWNADPPRPSTLCVPTEVGPLEKVEVLSGSISVPTYDEDWGPAPLAKRAMNRFLRRLPIVDYPEPWASREEALEVLGTDLSSILPLPNVEWTDKTSDRTIELLAWNGLASHRLEPLESDREGARYVVDLSFMHAFPVREGLERYGAAAYFTAEGKVSRIYTPHDDTFHRPGDAGWEDAKWRWKCSLFTVTTVTDHLSSVHLIHANLMVTATREHLPPDHPIRRLLKPYEFRTVAINYDAALGLAPEGGLAHRAFGFTYPGLAQCLLQATRTLRAETFPDLIARKQVSELGDRFPFATDGLALWRIIRDFVTEYATIFYPGEALSSDAAVRAFWQGLAALAPGMQLRPLTSSAAVLDMLTQFIFTVTGLHEHVGSVAEYLTDPAFLGSKLRKGERIADVQSTVQILSILAATGFKQPPLLGDYTHLLLDRERGAAESAMARYQGSLRALAEEIAARNTRRAQPFQSFNPSLLQSSVSI